MNTDLTQPTAADDDATTRQSIRSVVLCATPGAGEEVVARAFEACGAGMPRRWFDVRRVAPGLLARWDITDLDDYIAALHEHRTPSTGIFGLVLHWHDLRRIHRQVADLRQPTAQRMLDVVEVLAPQPAFVRVRRADREAHVDALQALEQHDDTASDPWLSAAERSRLRARIDATEIVWTQWFDSLGVNPPELVHEEVLADPTLVPALVAGITELTAMDVQVAAGPGVGP